MPLRWLAFSLLAPGFPPADCGLFTASCVANQNFIGLIGTVTFSLCSESPSSRPDEESESTEWETDTDASDDEGESEQASVALA